MSLRLLVVKFLGNQKFMWIFDCAGGVSVPNPCDFEGSTLVEITMTFG